MILQLLETPRTVKHFTRNNRNNHLRFDPVQHTFRNQSSVQTQVMMWLEDGYKLLNNNTLTSNIQS